eukprot:CAMPEP_0185026868 /NCGR_PEP_ID=MMETSP1103-20130426/11415_1 /TAXON_ID=36769 /ORGANISM="Paraphysomonas bandaiensis, Strain Caron Lab Isolate" /LENGTH=367 /DNA_ID=CAMNT_0027560599 /DNA_START=59 /DNA_END=1159 /DNA_ORIENTATION=+
MAKMDLSYGHSPFPFSERPTLPHIDAFQDNAKLKVSKESIHMSPVSKPTERLSLENNDKYGYFTVKDIRQVYRFMKSCGSDESYGITLDEMESAFRKVKRAHKNKDEEYHARRLMNTFEFLLKIKSLTPKMWFKEVDTSQANKGDGKLTWLEFETGMNKLCEDLGASLFTKHDLTIMLKYLDPNGDGDLSYQEVSKGFRRIHRTADCKAIMMSSGPIIPYLQDFMRDRQIRVRDLFNFLDIKNKKAISLEVLCEGIERVGAFTEPVMLSTDYADKPNDSAAIARTNYKAPQSADRVSELRGRKSPSQHPLRSTSNHLPPLCDGLLGTKDINAGTSEADLNRSAALKAKTHRDYQNQVKKHFRVYDDW